MSPQHGTDNPDRPGSEDPTRIKTSTVAAGTVIGPYHLLQPVGQGGMGEVWLADQKQPVRRRVAIKLIKAGMDTCEVVARFESERQALALMDHPAIAKVFDAGSTAEGRPYFVMEYVIGVPITEYCDKHRLTTRQRLELYVDVCEGVQHAHQKAILHRDLKPSNILVGDADGKPRPRIIDFGVAKATSQRLTAQTMFTQAGAVIGTPAYMSPEQADSAGQDVDTRTDVYSLGVVLYELLVGALPLDFSKVPMEEIPRKLREEDAPRPSTKLRTLGEQSTVAAQNRGADARTLTRELRGDLDAITLKALEKDRTRRYATPSELAADIERYLRNEPVIARPASPAYSARKYVRRHRLGVAVAAVLFAMLVSFAVAQAFELRRITRERDRATRERDRANRITGFMTQMFKVSDPSQARGNTVTAREILDNASKEVDTGLSKDPELQAQMMHVMGDVYDQLGLYDRAQSLLTRAVDIRRRVLGLNNPDTLSSMNVLAWILQEQGRYSEAEKMQREITDLHRRMLGPDHPETLMSICQLAVTLSREARYPEAEKMLRDALGAWLRIRGPQYPETLTTMSNLAIVLHNAGRNAEAEKLARDALDIRRRSLGTNHPDTLAAMHNLGWMLEEDGRYPEAEKLQRETLDIRRRVLGPEHPETLTTLNNLASTLQLEGRYSEADTLQREALDISRRALGPEHPFTAMSVYNLGGLQAHQGHKNEAFALLRNAVDHGLEPGLDLGIETDPDLKSLHGDPRFAALVAHAKERAATAK